MQSEYNEELLQFAWRKANGRDPVSVEAQAGGQHLELLVEGESERNPPEVEHRVEDLLQSSDHHRNSGGPRSVQTELASVGRSVEERLHNFAARQANGGDRHSVQQRGRAMLGAFCQWCRDQYDVTLGYFRGLIEPMKVLGFYILAVFLVGCGVWACAFFAPLDWSPSLQPIQAAAEPNAPAAPAAESPASEQEHRDAAKPKPEADARPAARDPRPAHAEEVAAEATSPTSLQPDERKSVAPAPAASEPKAPVVTNPGSESGASSTAAATVPEHKSPAATEPGTPAETARPASDPRGQDAANASEKPKHALRKHARKTTNNPLSLGWKSFEQSFQKGFGSLFRGRPPGT